MAITFDDVKKSILELKSRGEPISVINIRLLLGAGSNTTIQRHMINYKNKIKQEYKDCTKCNGKGKVKIRNKHLETTDTLKMKKIMKKYDFKYHSLAKVLGISVGTISGWFHIF